MKSFLFTNIMAGILLASFFYTDSYVNAYDIPKITIAENSEKDNETKQDITEGPVLDDNYIFIASYKGLNFYLDLYSIKIKKNTPNKRIWSQFIFPIGPNVTSINAKSKLQTFFFDGHNAYNSKHKNNLIDEVQEEEDRAFLWNCFKVGYQNAFNK